jgi:hypothetical protein
LTKLGNRGQSTEFREESEQIDELSKETLKSYQDKALKSNPGTRRGYERIIGVARSAEKLKKKD